MHKLVFIRAGESIWDVEDRFAGWTDVDLSLTGVEQANRAGRLLKAEGYAFDVTYTSVLKRATRTLWHVLDEMDSTWLPVVHSWRLNERHFGTLQGLTEAETGRRYGETQVQAWRRSYDTPPPAMTPDDPRCERSDPRYAKLNSAQIPLTESLKDTVPRVEPFWNEALAPALRMHRRVLVVAHSHSVRALVRHLDEISDDDIVRLNVPKGMPLVYELDDSLKPIRHYHLNFDDAAAEKASEVETSVNA